MNKLTNKLEDLYQDKGYVDNKNLNESINISGLRKLSGNVYKNGIGYLSEIFKGIINNSFGPVKNIFGDILITSNPKMTINKIILMLKLLTLRFITTILYIPRQKQQVLTSHSSELI